MRNCPSETARPDFLPRGPSRGCPPCGRDKRIWPVPTAAAPPAAKNLHATTAAITTYAAATASTRNRFPSRYGPTYTSAASPKNGACRRCNHAAIAVSASMVSPLPCGVSIPRQRRRGRPRTRAENQNTNQIPTPAFDPIRQYRRADAATRARDMSKNSIHTDSHK